MRFLVKFSMPTEAGNAAAKSGKFATLLPRILNEIKPEAAYFAEVDGQRTGFLFVNIQDAHQLPAIAEPFFLGFGAHVEFHPAMTPQDLQKAGPDIERAVKSYG